MTRRGILAWADAHTHKRARAMCGSRGGTSTGFAQHPADTAAHLRHTLQDQFEVVDALPVVGVLHGCAVIWTQQAGGVQSQARL